LLPPSLIEVDPHHPPTLGGGTDLGEAGPLVTAQRILDLKPSVVHVVPLTSTIRRFHSEVVIEPDPANGLDTTTAAQCQHLRAISSGRISNVRGNVGAQVLAQVRETIAVLLDLPG
jgi:mRNA interferase MazF